jgi:hypothetical protein
MKRLILTALLFSTTAMAETLTWNPPTERADGTPLDPMTEIAEYRLVCGEVVTSIDPTVAEGEQYEFRKHQVLPGYGAHDCHMTAVDTDGLESEPSMTLMLEWEQAAPRSPTDVLVIVE